MTQPVSTASPLLTVGRPATYRDRQLAQIAFPLGGIGTGTVSLGGRGNLRDWEIFNRPDKGRMLPWAFFALVARREGMPTVFKVLEAPPMPPYTETHHAIYDGNGFGVRRDSGAGLPHMREAVFTGEYPFARIDFTDAAMPVQVSLQAWNPMIPLNADDSGIPVAIFQWTLTNPTAVPVEITLLGNLPAEATPGVGEITIQEDADLTALQVTFNKENTDAPNYGTLALSTPWDAVTYETHWNRAAWYTSLTDWVQRLLDTGRLRDDDTPAAEKSDVGSLGLTATLAPGETITMPVYLTWSFPNYEKYWHFEEEKPRWRNYYALQYPGAISAARYAITNIDRLERETRLFHQTLFDSTLPPYVLDAISSQMSIIRSTTCLRLPDGALYGFEGCHGNAGCCEGSCTHVWQYAQSHAFLYPALERSMRETEYSSSMFPDGKVGFRLQLPPGSDPSGYHACADGQMGAIMQIYRDWQLGAGDDWLRKMWPYVQRSLDYAWHEWDANRDGLLEGIQHNTYDIEFHGANPLCNGLYLGALRAAVVMGEYLGDSAFVAECRRIGAAGAEAMDRDLFNGEYYYQPLEPGNDLINQVGTGCLIDQLLGQQKASLYGLGDLLNPDHVRTALQSVYRNNFKTDFWEFQNYERIFTLNDEAGAVICTWPHGGRPRVAFPYCDETMIGFEYQLAAHLIQEGMLEEGLTVTKAVRDRHDGVRRNPWNECECGNHYARSMANWSVKLALDGFSFRATEGQIGFAPKMHQDDYSTFWSTATGWGSYTQRLASGCFTLQVQYGSQAVQRITLAAAPEGSVTVMGPDGEIIATRTGQTIELAAPLALKAGSALMITVNTIGEERLDHAEY